MTEHYLSYPLQNDYVHNWLVAGPLASPIDDLAQFQGDDVKLQIARQVYRPDSGITEPPLDWTSFTVAETELTWKHTRCPDDHFVNLTGFYHTCHHLQAWAYAELVCDQAQTIEAILTTNGPADIWLNDDHAHRHEHFHHQLPGRVAASLSFQAGVNKLLVRFEGVAVRACPNVMALQLPGFTSSESKPVRIPLADDLDDLYHRLEDIFTQSYLDRDVFVNAEKVVLNWPLNMRAKESYSATIQAKNNRVYGTLETTTDESKKRPLMTAYELVDGNYNVVVRPGLASFYENNVRVEHRASFYSVRNKYSQAPYGTHGERRYEALRDAAMRTKDLYSEIAKMAGGWWSSLGPQAILDSIDSINRRADCSDFYLVGLLGILYRFGNHEEFPEEVKQPLEDCILNFRYWLDEPGDDAMCFWSENHQILFHTCEVLAGQRFPDHVFSNSGMTGQQHRQKGEQLALAWLKKRARYGFEEWDSNCYFEHDLLALSHLLDLGEAQEVYELAALVMDKIFLTMALNSFKGTFGSTHGRSYTPYIKGSYLETTAGVSRLMWGMGIFNEHTLGTVSLACCENYQLPELIAGIAIDTPEEEVWAKERHAGQYDPAVDLKEGAWEVNKVTYKTADYMLCSAQDYRPGEPGVQQHIWQATMGPDAVVFVNHPACLSEDGSHRPGCWHGNVVLPRVAQWKDVLIAIHKFSDDDWLGFTHAYFPRYAFDQRVTVDGWAFARKDEAYIALTAAQGFDLIRRGQNAYRELRSYGHHNIWLCQMGRKARDGSLEDFRNKILSTPLTFDDLSVSYTSLRGDEIRFGWEEPLLVNGESQPLSGYKHYESPYAAAEWPASILAVGYGHNLMRLNMGD